MYAICTKEIDERAWRRSGHNPVEFLSRVDPVKLQRLPLIPHLSRNWKESGIVITPIWPPRRRPCKKFSPSRDHSIAYFSAEYGIHSACQIMPEALGNSGRRPYQILQHLGIPIFGIGLMYKHAYFQQQIDEHGNQSETFNILDPEKLPMQWSRMNTAIRCW